MTAVAGIRSARARSPGFFAALGLVPAAALFAIFHPDLGIVGDAALYLGRALADLDPNGVGRDIVFVDDGQSRFSVFPHLADPLVAALGAQRASMVIAFAALACLFAATLALARALTSDRRLVFAIMVLVAVLPTAYGDGIMRYAEATAVPRPFAEAAVMAAVAALLVDRRFTAGLLLLVALVVHPIMAMAGIGTVLVLLAWRETFRAGAMVVLVFALATLLFAALGAAGVPLLDRLVARIDPEWLAMLRARSAYLFPSLWHAQAFVGPAVHLTTIVLATHHASLLRRRIFVAVALSASLQLVATMAFGDGLHLLLAVQEQGWRALWLLAVVGSCCLPLVAVEAWRAGPQARVVLALLGLAWLGDLGLPLTLTVCAAAIALDLLPTRLPLSTKHATWALATVATLVTVGAIVTAVGWFDFVAGAPRAAMIGLLSAERSGFVVVPVALALAAWLLGPARPERSNMGVVTLGLAGFALVGAAGATWDQRIAANAFYGRQDGFAAAPVPGRRSAEVLVLGGLAGAWFALGRPQYFSPEQAVSIVFSRPLAMEWRRRATVLQGLGLVTSQVFRPWEPLTPAERITVTPGQLALLCARDDAPAAVIVPDRDDALAPHPPGATTWTPPDPLPVVENERPLRWHLVRGWVVVPCHAPALAKSGGR